MRCPRCQHDNEAGANFCEECAAPFERACAQCGGRLSPTAKFCPACAHPAGQPAAPPAPRFGSPKAYTPTYLAERILTSRSALEGERKQVTVLFADLKSSMEIVADRDLEAAQRVLDAVLERMIEAVHRYEGTVNQVMGDGIMALFGAPVGHEDHAARACYAALRMQESVSRYADGVRRQEGITLRIRVGLNSGEVVVRAISSDLRMDYTAVGPTTHLAARMEQLADPGTTLLTAATLALGEDFVQVKALGPMRVKGLPEPVEVYELVGANPVRSRFHVRAAHGLTTFVGRTGEMAQLGEALEQARRGHGEVAAVVGDPGVGKSRLFWEFVHSPRVDGCLVLQAAAVSYGKTIPYLPVMELLRAYFLIEPGDDTRKIREKITGKLFALDRALEPALPALLALLDVPVDDEEWARLDPSQRRQRTLEALRRLLLRESQVRPLVLVFEDLHWIDGETQAMLDELVDGLPTVRALLLINYRPEYQHAWGSKTYYRQVRVDTLSAASADELLDTLLGRDPALGDLKRLLIARTDGNPFFLEESVRTLLETRVLSGAPRAYRLTGAPESLQIPATAQAMLAARIDRLQAGEKRLLQTASVIGRDVPITLLGAIADVSEGELRRDLARLQAAEFLYETRLFPDVEYTFKHALTHEVALGSLLHRDQRALHARIVDAVERLHADRIVEHVERLVRHAVEGELWDKAVRYARDAGAKALAHSASRQAVTWFEQALQALDRLPAGDERRRQAIDLHLYAASPLFSLGQIEPILEHLRRIEALTTAADDPSTLGRTYSYMAECLLLMAEPALALDYAGRGLDMDALREKLPIQAGLRFVLGHACHALGEYRRAATELEWHVGALTGDLRHRRLGFTGILAVLARVFQASSLAELGEFGDAVSRADEAVRIAEEASHPFSLAAAYWSVGSVRLCQGDHDGAIAALERARQLAERWEIPLWPIWIAPVLGASHLRAGAVERALPLMETAVGQIEALGVLTYHSLLVAHLAEASLVGGRLTEAADLAGQALELTRRHGERGTEAYVLRLLGDIGARRDPTDLTAAGELYRQALTMAGERGMRPLVAHCHLGLATLARLAGKRPDAAEHLGAATTLYREMGMTYWAEKAERESSQV